MSRWAMNWTIWRKTSTAAPFSASSANAIVEVVVIVVAPDKVGGSHLNLIRTLDGHPCSGRLDSKTYTTCRDITARAEVAHFRIAGARWPRFACGAGRFAGCEARRGGFLVETSRVGR